MEDDNRSIRDSVEKFNIKLKSKPKDGVILQLHHTVRGSNGECRRIRFSTGTFEDSQEKLACIDNVGNLFILDFSELKFWKLSSMGPCSSLHFIPNKVDTLVIAAVKKFDLHFVNCETGKISLTLTGHTMPVKHISFSSNKFNNMLTASPAEAILWELRNYTKYFTLNTYLGAQIQQIMFTPASEYLVACFRNDTVQIWKHETMKSIKQIIPSNLKHLKTIAFTINGRAMAMAGLTPMLILFSMDTWKALNSIDLTKFSISGTQQIAFIPQLFDGGANKIIAILSSDCILHLLDLETLTIVYRICPDSSGIRKFVVSPTGKYFLCILQQGEINIYNSSYVISTTKNTAEDHCKKSLPAGSMQGYVALNNSPLKAQVEQKMRICMDSARLRRILMQYGEYPDKFRSIIWKSLLDTPGNKTAYSALLNKGIHPSYKDIEKQFTIHSSITLKNLKRLLSCLAHWCPLFGVTKFLPGFVFPFVKVLQKDPLLLFECVATVLLNHCQLWFEYAPFPPISILAMIENILAEHDQQLLDHYCKIGVTSQTYALKILETAFSEVLTCTEWLILWDHILSNEPAYIIMAVVSYNIVQKNALKRLKSYEQLDNFFHMQNPIDKKTFLKKTYLLLNETPADIHPRRFFNTFIPLEKGVCYRQFTGYPKATICLKLAKKKRKKANIGNKYTLGQLTTMSQEKEINERFKSHVLSDNSINDDDSNSEEFHDNCTGNNSDNGRVKKTVTEDLLENILYPATIHLHKDSRNNKSNINDVLKHSSKIKKKIAQRTTNNLEKEVEKLLKSHTNSDLSDS